jgi:hypothetical protein
MGVHTIYTRQDPTEHDTSMRERKRITMDEIRRSSPDGLPASSAGPKWLVFSVLAISMVFIVAAVAAGVLISPLVGVIVLLLGFGIGLFGNPEVWVAASRARERQQIIQHHWEDDGVVRTNNTQQDVIRHSME